MACRQEMHRIGEGGAALIYHRAFYFLPLVRKNSLSVWSVFQAYEKAQALKMDSDPESTCVPANESIQLWDYLTLWLRRSISSKGKKNTFSVLSDS